MHAKARRLIAPLIPSGIRSIRKRAYLGNHFGLTDLGREEWKEISGNSTFGRNCRIGGRVVIIASHVGDYSYIESDTRVCYARVGRFTSIANFVQVGLASHPLGAAVSTHPAFYSYRPESGYRFVDTESHTEFAETSVGSDVWIGASSCILGGVKVGHGAIIGAGAIVTRDVPPFAIVVGSPARVLRYRFDQSTVDFLLQLEWWNQSEDWLATHGALMGDIHKLRAAVD